MTENGCSILSLHYNEQGAQDAIGVTTTSTGLLKWLPSVINKKKEEAKISLQNVIYSDVQAYFAFRSYEYLRAFNEAWFGINEFKVNEN